MKDLIKVGLVMLLIGLFYLAVAATTIFLIVKFVMWIIGA